YYFQDAGTTDAYTFDTDTITASSTFYVTKKTAESTWYGTTTYHKESVIESREMHIFTHSIEADRPIGVEFIGFTAGAIDVDSNADIILRGQLLNPSGTTTLDADGDILQQGDEAVINSKRIVLTADNIGVDGEP